MLHIRKNAENSVRSLLKDVAERAGTNVLESVDYLDDGSPVRPPFFYYSTEKPYPLKRYVYGWR
jgi:hypothetical protein